MVKSRWRYWPLPDRSRILRGGNKAFSELYQIRGEVHLEKGNHTAAKHGFELALKYNENFEPARQALDRL